MPAARVVDGKVKHVRGDKEPDGAEWLPFEEVLPAFDAKTQRPVVIDDQVVDGRVLRTYAIEDLSKEQMVERNRRNLMIDPELPTLIDVLEALNDSVKMNEVKSRFENLKKKHA